MRKIIKFPMCSFCGKGRRLAGCIIVGEKSCICDECVEFCVQILKEEKIKKSSDGEELNKTEEMG